MANIKMPIEIKPDNTIVPLQHLSNVYVVSIIDSINEIIVDRSLPDIVGQSHRLFQEREPTSAVTEPEPAHENPIQVSHPQLWIRPEELRKTHAQFKKNTSFKNRGKYNHRATAKMREHIDTSYH
jgi:hypothetical protein